MPVVDERITMALAGKPAWALHARLTAVWWHSANEKLNRYCDAIEEHDPTRVRFAAAEVANDLEPMMRLVAEITVPGNDRCVEALAAIAGALANGELPSGESLLTVSEFLDFVRA